MRKKKNKVVCSVVDVLDGSRNDTENSALRLTGDQSKSDDGFKGYLSANMQPPARILRKEQRIFRNKILVTAVFVLMILYIIIFLILA